MKKPSSKTLKVVATKKAKTGSMKVKKSRTSSKRTTSPTSYWTTASVSNLKDSYLTATGESWSVSGDVIPKSTCEFCLVETTRLGEGVNRTIRIGLKGLEYRGQSGGKFHKIGWDELDDIAIDSVEWA